MENNEALLEGREINLERKVRLFKIIVNGREKTISSRKLSFSEIVALAFDNPPNNPNTIFTITYRRGFGNKPEGSLVEGEKIKVKKGMIFNVTATDKS